MLNTYFVVTANTKQARHLMRTLQSGTVSQLKGHTDKHMLLWFWTHATSEEALTVQQNEYVLATSIVYL